LLLEWCGKDYEMWFISNFVELRTCESLFRLKDEVSCI
jgi:hypothetical protein